MDGWIHIPWIVNRVRRKEGHGQHSQGHPHLSGKGKRNPLRGQRGSSESREENRTECKGNRSDSLYEKRNRRAVNKAHLFQINVF